MTKEVMKQALEALKNTSPLGFNTETDRKFYATIDALEEALKQEQGEQLARLGWQEIDCPICGGGARAFPKQKQELWGSSLITNPDFVEEQKKKTQQLYEMLGEQEQVEPVGKFAKFTDGIWREVTDGSSGVPLYTHSKEWVGLTKKDMSEFASKTPNWEELCYLVETKLKNKNT